MADVAMSEAASTSTAIEASAVKNGLEADMRDMTVEDEAEGNGLTDALGANEEPLDSNSSSTTRRLPVTVTKPTPYTFDLGHLLCTDPNPLPSNPTEAQLSSAARDCAQVLLNQLLTACPVVSSQSGVSLQLPAPATPLPREKPVPQEKPKTKWQEFAEKKGIKKKKEGKMVYDEEKGDWVPRWGYKGANKSGEDDWLVEVDERRETETGEAHDARRDRRDERKERARRNERKMRANERRARKNGA